MDSEIPETGGPYGKTSTGDKFWVKTNPGQSFTFTCTPAASAVLGENSPSGLPAGSVGVTYEAFVYPVRLNLVGVLSASDKRLLIGQRLRAALTLGGFLPSGQTRYTWQIKGGDPFTSYVASTSTATYEGWGDRTEFTGSIEVFFADPDEIEVSCSVETITPSLQFEVKESLTSVPPTRSHSLEPVGKMELIRETSPQQYVVDLTDPTEFALWGAQYPQAPPKPPLVWGMFYDVWVTTPSPFAPPDYGSFAFVQLVSNASSASDGLGGSIEHDPAWGLDKMYPHSPPGWKAATPQAYVSGFPEFAVFSDKPGFRGLSSPAGVWIQLNVSDLFQLFDIYVPPDSAAGASAIVPLNRFVWKAVGSAYWSGSQWTRSDEGSTGLGNTMYPAHPVWSRVWVN
jgi:hypothetical protein